MQAVSFDPTAALTVLAVGLAAIALLQLSLVAGAHRARARTRRILRELGASADDGGGAA